MLAETIKETSSSLTKLSTFPSNTNTYWKFTQSSTAAIDAASLFILTLVHHETRNKQSISKSYLLSHLFHYFDRTSHLERNVSACPMYSIRTNLGYTHAGDNLSLSLALIKSSVSSSFKNKKVVLKSNTHTALNSDRQRKFQTSERVLESSNQGNFRI